MAYINYYPTRINWQNYPQETTPLDEINLNKMDYALFMIDQLLANWYNSKANVSALNDYKAEANAEMTRLNTVKADKTAIQQDIKSVTYNSSTGVWKFTHQNGTVDTFDQNIEKIPVSFTLSPQGIITMTTADGTKYTCDIASILKVYTFNDTSTVDFTTVTDSNGNKIITAKIIDGSLDEAKFSPSFLNDFRQARDAAQAAALSSENSSIDSEAWAKGTRQGIPVPSTDETYQKNSKYYSDQAQTIANNTQDIYNDMCDRVGASSVTIDYTTGNLIYSNDLYYTFTINTTTGNLEWEVNP